MPVDATDKTHRLIYVFISRQSAPEHIFTDRGSRDVRVNHGQQFPPQTDGGILCQSGSYSVSQYYSEMNYDARFMAKNDINSTLLSVIHSLDVKVLWEVT